MRKISIAFGIFVLIAGMLFAVTKGRNIKNTSGFVGTFGKPFQKETASLEAASFVSPHHLVAEKLIDDIFSKVAEKNKNSSIERIILVSPNHFNLGKGWAIASDADWDSGQGAVKADTGFVDMLSTNGQVHKDNSAFQKEHGILNLVPYVKKYFPKAKIVPLMLRDGFPAEKVNALAGILANKADEKTIFVLSADFSHYLEKNISHLHDEKSIDILSNLDFPQSAKADIDCVPGLQLMMKFSMLRGFDNFTLEKNSNSSEILGKDFLGENTSYVTGFYGKGEEKSERVSSMMFFGDLMLDRNIRAFLSSHNPDFITDEIQRLFWGQDMNIANLEGPVTSNASVSVAAEPSEKNHFVFTFDADESAQFLKHNEINVVNIGNNHILNFNENGLNETKNMLAQNDVAYFGNPLDKDNYLIKDINGRKVALVNYNQFSGIGVHDVENIISEVKKKSDLVVVYAHWGAEYELRKTDDQREKAHQFIDAGADMIIGSHPHVVEPLEIYKNRIIFYSLGNFVFDQYFSEDTKTMLAVGVLIRDNHWEFALEPLYQARNGQLVLAPEDKRDALLERLANDSEVDYTIKKDIRDGSLNIFQ